MIKIIKTSDELKSFRAKLIDRVGFAPTMGNLHQGHISLIEQSLKENEHTILSIFVNPKQFGPTEDFDRYPRTFMEDKEKVEELLKNYPNKSVTIFHPENQKEIYPANFSTMISVPALNDILCGKVRPGHFDGVCTVMYQLLSLTKPHVCYMGQKDYQQITIVKRMVADLDLAFEIKMMPIIRDFDGLALSSRNRYLSTEDRKQALTLPHSLKKIEQALKEKRSEKEIHEQINALLKDQRWDYLEIRHPETLSLVKEAPCVIIGAYRLGTTRLLDNIVVA